MIADSSIVIDRISDGEDILEDVCIVTAVEHPPVLDYPGFEGSFLSLTAEDQIKAIEIQKNLRSIGKAVPAPDLMIAAVAINRGLEVLTGDRDFQDIESVTDLEVVFEE